MNRTDPAHRLRNPRRPLAVAALFASLTAMLAVADPVLLGMSEAQASATRSSAPAMSGDLIVKFRDASPDGALLAAIVEGRQPMASAAPLATRWSGELGVPLQLVQVTSGREALLAVDREALLRTLAQRAARLPGVKRATPQVPAPGLPSDLSTLALELGPQADTAAIAARLASGDFVRPRLSRDPGGGATLSVDIAALTLTLIERMRRQDGVEYVQANRLLRPVQPGTAK